MGLSLAQWGMILGGFGMFMFGIRFMGDGLKAAAGDKLRDYINKYTSKPVSAMIIGIILTMILQSSSATTAITIGLVRAGLMSLVQAAGIVLGANVGTTFTSFLISINIEKYAMFVVFLGAIFICFAKKQKVIHTGEIVLGFGLIFYGMSTMGDALASLKSLPWFENFALSMAQNPIMALFAGMLLTAAVQSSAATIGVAQKLYQAGAITFSAALPFMFGANVGTTITGVLASISGSTAGKRTAAIHTILNIIATTIGMIFLVPFSNIVLSLTSNMNPMMQIAVANIIFKVITTVIFLPFINQLVELARKIIPGKELSMTEIDVDEMDTEISTLLPSAAISASQNAILKMLDLVRVNITKTQDLLNTKNTEELEVIQHNESTINKFDRKISD
ncbi:MAG: Na/Pi cotransporter family protein, partial [Solobacterium sp.]|nr:Na/Pi cotransporter family protein [Solobacterium sp.]